MPGEILTIGHSTHAIERFLELLTGNGIEVLADVRRDPGSRRNPQFNSAALAASLARAEIAYEELGEQLGGRRKPAGSSLNAGWQVDAFRGYADYMEQAEFAAGLGRLRGLAGGARAVVMCAEADWRRCHRRLIADALTATGWRVGHIAADGALSTHVLTPFALVDGERVTYPPAQGRLTD